MCATGRCVEGKRYETDSDSDRYHEDLRKHPGIAYRNACKVPWFRVNHDDCETCDLIRMGF